MGNILSKSLTVAVILLFIGLAISPSIYADDDIFEKKKLVIDFVGVNDKKSYVYESSKDTVQEILELLEKNENLLRESDDFYESLKIIEDTIVGLESYGLLDENDGKLLIELYKACNNENIYRLINSSYFLDFFDNIFCFLFLHTTEEKADIVEIGLLSLPFLVFFILWGVAIANMEVYYMFSFMFLMIIFGIIGIPVIFLNYLIPIKLWVLVILGWPSGASNDCWSFGLKGYVEEGDINFLVGFKGLRIREPIEKTEYYIGHALAIFDMD